MGPLILILILLLFVVLLIYLAAKVFRRGKNEAAEHVWPIGVNPDGASCPQCGSANLHIERQGYDPALGALGIRANKGKIIGATWGSIGQNKLRITCMNCGKWYIL